MSLINQQVGPYRLVRKLHANQDFRVYQAVHTRSSEKRIIQLAKLEGKLNNKESRKRLKQNVESIRAIKSPHTIPILKYDIAKMKGKNYFYILTPCFISGSLEEWLQLRGKTNPLSQQDANTIMRQAREAVEAFHKSGIAPLNIELSSFMVEATENPNRPQVFLNDTLLAILSARRIRKDKGKSKAAITEDRYALAEMEKLLNQSVEETTREPAESLESPLQILERRLVIAEEEKEQLQRQLRELEQEKERLIQDQQKQKESDAKLLAGATLATAGASGAGGTPIAPSNGGTSRWTGRWFWALGSLLLLSLLLAGSVFLLAGLFFFGKPAWAFGSSTAKVTITQAAYELTDSYIFTGVTHSISRTKTQSITVPATNVVFIPGSRATGTLTFNNTQRPCKVARTIPAGTVFTNSRGISVVTDRIAILGTSCTATAPAHAAKIGPAGNISAHTIRQIYIKTIIVDNPTSFVGGQFDISYMKVQQSDIDHAASSLEARLKQETLNVLRMQLQTNEQFVSSPTCKSKVASDHQVNDVATHLTVTVTTTCTAGFYNSQEILSQSEQMLNARAQALFGPNYALTGDITAEITHIATDVKQGTLVTVVASGLWTYQFSSARVNQLVRLITGKDKQDAQSILSNQKGVQSVSISISNNDSTMPNDANSINIAYVSTLVPIDNGVESRLAAPSSPQTTLPQISDRHTSTNLVHPLLRYFHDSGV
jgi:serine/threonine protein kinase